tara:strand:- start:23 stop:169 length:147 start_codon:yes stop_codon:yes gene_type:complete
MNFITDDIFLDADGNYFLYFGNSDCNAQGEVSALTIGPLTKDDSEIPF